MRQARCRVHELTEERYLVQLRRLQCCRSGDRGVYDSLVADVVGSRNPLELFKPTEQRPGAYLVEALYRAHVELATGDYTARPTLAPLGYARWVTWRQLGDAVVAGSVCFNRRMAATFKDRSRGEVIAHLGNGWRPAPGHDDPELDRLILRYS